jgi:hypothetical protein
VRIGRCDTLGSYRQTALHLRSFLAPITPFEKPRLAGHTRRRSDIRIGRRRAAVGNP